MKFNLVSLETGRIKKQFSAKDYDDAVSIAEANEWDLDDNFIESSKETDDFRNSMTDRQWNSFCFGEY